jgi:hypothetical protein
LAAGSQTLVWLDGETLCVTREFQAALGGQVPPWLARWHMVPATTPSLQQTLTTLPGGGLATLVRRWVNRPFCQFWDWLWHRPLTSPEIRQAGLIFRLQRYGIATPRLLAVGQRRSFPGPIASFLLTEHVPGSIPLTTWLTTATCQQRRWGLRAAARMLRRLHSAGCALRARPGNDLDALFRVQPHPSEAPAVVLGSVAPLQSRRHSGAVPWRWNLAVLRTWLAPRLARTDELRFLLAYLGMTRLTPAAKHLARQLRRETRGALP